MFAFSALTKPTRAAEAATARTHRLRNICISLVSIGGTNETPRAERHSSPAGAACNSIVLRGTRMAAPVRWSGWFASVQVDTCPTPKGAPRSLVEASGFAGAPGAACLPLPVQQREQEFAAPGSFEPYVLDKVGLLTEPETPQQARGGV